MIDLQNFLIFTFISCHPYYLETKPDVLLKGKYGPDLTKLDNVKADKLQIIAPQKEERRFPSVM